MSKARERQTKRRQTQEMVRHTDTRPPRRQAAPEGSFQLPEFQLPFASWLLLIPLGVIVIIIVVIALSFINPPEVEVLPNAIWLDSRWSYSQPSIDDLSAFTRTLRDNDIGRLFIYTSSLKADGTWSGILDDRNRFNEVEERLTNLVTQLRAASPNLELYAWVEVTTSTPTGYRLDNLQIHNTVSNFSTLMVNDMGFDGVLLDVKPIFEENEDLITMLRTVNDAIGLDTPLLLVVPADLTPTGTDLVLPPMIAPGTEWSAEYKQRVALGADQLVITVYNSYHSNPVDYIEWVAYQVDTFTDALTQMDTGATILVSVPAYAENPPAHDATIESLAGALDGVRRGVDRLVVETETPLFEGVAIFTDHLVTDDEWSVFRDKWVNR
jgi:hypothetical protein